MIQAIVFLPLLGAILAGLISIFGAHARNPSGDTVEHHDDAHGADAHSSDAHDDDADGHGHDDHHAAEPPAMRGSNCFPGSPPATCRFRGRCGSTR
jgi:NADH-quinone oxidoreductase subunit L